jgi:hypothetical protein
LDAIRRLEAIVPDGPGTVAAAIRQQQASRGQAIRSGPVEENVGTGIYSEVIYQDANEGGVPRAVGRVTVAALGFGVAISESSSD